MAKPGGLSADAGIGRVTPADEDTRSALEPGTRVEVRQRFDAGWSRGFEIVDRSTDGYRLRRLSDGSELPTVFAADDVRSEKARGRSMWWY